MINGLPEETQNEIRVPRQFMDKGRAAIVELKDENSSFSSLDGIRCQSGSPPNEIVESMDCNKTPTDQRNSGIRKRDDQEKCTPNRVPNFNNNNTNTDHELQASDETMSRLRKARVSVRVRSESHMVITN